MIDELAISRIASGASRSSTLSVIIPVMNEARTIAPLLRNVQAAQVSGVRIEIVVVDDGSTDGTREILERFGQDIRLILHDRNRGKGAAVRSGFQAATGDLLLIQDADLEYDAGDYPRLLEPILQGEADAVIGSRFVLHRPRFFTNDGRPFVSHFLGNMAIIWLTNLLYGFRATDYEGCYKAFSRHVIQETPLVSNGFELDNEIICKLFRRGWRIKEVPIRYVPRGYREGKKIRWQHGLRMLWAILKWRVAPF